MDLIREINRSNGLAHSDGTGLRDDPVVASLRGILERACETLSRDLYNTKTHFLLEFIQNADDNEYEPHVVPNLQLRLHGRELVIRCNEKGFRAENVRAICDVRRSTKTKGPGKESCIGEKGIGFKAVFAVAERVHVASREFTFRFDRDGLLGMINPIWDPSHRSDSGWTTFRLGILPSLDIGDLGKELQTIHPTLLLFLRRLRTMDVEIGNSDSAGDTKIMISRMDEPGDIVRLESYKNGECISTSRYLVFKQMTPTYPEETKRQGIRESEIVLAFPVSAEGKPEIHDQFVHAFLPVAKYGLPFLVQADFLTPSSREGIISDSKWNLMLFDGIVDVFLRAVERFQQDPVLKFSWIRYIPTHAQPPFTSISEKIIAQLRTREVLISSDGHLRRPIDVVTLPKGLRINHTEPLIPPEYLPSVHYLSDSYDASRDRLALTKLGVKPISEQNVLDGLVLMDRANAIRTRGEQWHETACTHLNAVPQIRGAVNRQILGLRLLPLNDGSWRAARDAKQFVFTADLDIVQDVEFQCIADEVKENTARYKFFLALGVRRMDSALIATKILFQSNSSASLQTLIRYARFFYESRNKEGLPCPSPQFRVMVQDGSIAMSGEVYMELPEAAGGEFKLRDILPPEAKFLHSDYVTPFAKDRYWLSWLQDSLGVHTSPRIVSGRPSREIYSMASHLDTARFLAVLRTFWNQISVNISPMGLSDLSCIEVVCDDGVAHPLRTTALKRQNLSWIPSALSTCLNLISVKNPDDPSWGFLASIGVTMEANAHAWVAMLSRLQEIRSTDEKTIISVYQQLNARFVEAPESIRAAFQQRSLIFAPPDGQKRLTPFWVPLSDVYWDGPSTLRSRFIMKPVYADLEEFFVWKLGILNAPIEVLVGELITFTAGRVGAPITEDTVKTIEEMLVTISMYISWEPAWQFCLLSIVERPVFPVHFKEQILLQRYEQFYISEKGGKSNDRFRQSVPILAFSSAQTLSLLRPMFESTVWPHPPRMLESSLIPKSLPLGPKILNQEVTDLYSDRVEYMEKYVQHQTQYHPSPRQLEFLAKMRNVSIYVVDTIIIMWNLDGKTVNVQSDVKVSIDEKEEQVTFYVSNACAAMPRTRDREICSLLGDRDRVGIDKLALLQFVSMPWDDLLLFLQDEGVDVSTCIPQTTQESACEPDASAPSGAQDSDPIVQPPLASPVQTPPIPATDVLVDERQKPASNGRTPTARLKADAPASKVSPHIRPERAESPPLITDVKQTVRSPTAPREGGYRRRHSSTNGHSSMHSLDGTAPAPTLPSVPPPSVPPPSVPPPSVPPPSVPPPSVPPPSVLPPSVPRPSAPPPSVPSVPSPSIPPPSMPPPLVAPLSVIPSPQAPRNVDVLDGIDPRSSRSDDRDPGNGVLGELHVFLWLRSILGSDFTEKNWTSELRGQVAGFSPYNGPSIADFCYVDHAGILTNLWCSQKQKRLWKSRWPTYYLEVKTTSSVANEPFHMSAVQMHMARRFSLAAQASQPPQDVYVIIRVSEVKSAQPKHHVYVDPHKGMYDGELVITSEVDVVPRVAVQ